MNCLAIVCAAIAAFGKTKKLILTVKILSSLFIIAFILIFGMENIVIDYDKPVDEDGEQYQTYFFSIVDEADLLAAAEAAGVELPACVCTVKCAAGAINTDCPVCAVNMSECVGTKAEPEPVDEPEPAEPDPEQKSNTGTLLLILAVALIGGGAGGYFKVYRPKHQRAEQPEENYGDELEDYDDTPPWDEDESTEDDA